MRILLIEDDAGIGRFVSRGLARHGYDVVWERQGADALALLRTGGIIAAILDLGLPDIDGLALCRTLREQGIRTPILMLTARGALADRLDGFDCGADDYLVKPFAFEELVARLAVLVRRAGERQLAPLQFGALTLDLTTRAARVNDAPLALGDRAFALLAALVAENGRVVDRTRLAASVWGDDPGVTDNALDATISALRRRLDLLRNAPVIETLRGRGYRLVAH